MDNQFLNFGRPPISMGGLFFYSSSIKATNNQNLCLAEKK